MRRFEDTAGGSLLALMAILPLVEILARNILSRGIPGSVPFVQHLTLWVGFLGAAAAARENKLLALATGTFLPAGRARAAAAVFGAAVGAAVSVLLLRGGVELVAQEKESGSEIALGIPVWIVQLVLPLAFALIAVRLVLGASASLRGRLLAAIGLAAGASIALDPKLFYGCPVAPGLIVLIAGAAMGAPIFALLGGAAAWLFMHEGVKIAAVLIETYSLTVSPMLPALPLFTLTGFMLAEGGASTRLLRVFRAWFGWMPGGTAVVCVVVCAFFTTFTGGSGVTILALGVLLFKALKQDGYRERFSLGLLTSAGSLGLLFPPALPLILFGIVAQISIEDLFIGGLLPGALLVTLLGAWGIREGLLKGAGRTRFESREAIKALWAAKGELLLPVAILFAIFGGFTTLVEASALSAVYAFLLQFVFHRDLSIRRDMIRVLQQSVVLIGGVLVILGVAKGLSSYMVDAQIPARMVEWTQGNIHSPLVFLLLLNVFLLIVGCLLDIFSATVVVVPLILPIGLAFGIDPVHLGIIFVANLELGYLTPPVGLNLFLSSYRFERPILEVVRATIPMLVILGIGVLLITYWPWLTTGLLALMGRG